MPRIAAVTALAGWIGAAATPQAPLQAVRNGRFLDGTDHWQITQTSACSAKVVEYAEGPGKALCLKVDPPREANPWSATCRQTLDAFMDVGDRVVMKARMRSPQSCRVMPFLEVNAEPWTKSIGETVRLTPEWKEYTFNGTCAENYGPGTATFGFHVGFDTGDIEIADVRLIDLDARHGPIGEMPTMDNPQSMIENGDFSQGVLTPWTGPGGERLRAEAIETKAGPYRQGLRLTANPEQDAPPWNLQVGQPCNTYVRRGDAVYFRAWLRSPDSCRVTFVYELASAPHTKSIDQKVKPDATWKEFRFMGHAQQGFRPGESQAKFFVGHDPGVVEIAGVRVENCGAAPDSAFDQTIDYWDGRENPDTWREEALARIERVRKGDLTVTVLGGEGRPLGDARVRVTQQRHAFRFGTALPAARLLDSAAPDNLRFRREVVRLFNTVTFENDLKWPSMSEARLTTVDQALDWLRANRIDVRGHCLLWGSFKHLHSSIRDRRGSQLLDACKAHVAEYATRMRGKLYLWDVVNEAATNTEVWDDIGWEAFAQSFSWARQADPDVRLCYNDYGIVDENPKHRAKARERIELLLQHGAPVDVLGIQAHMHTPLTPIQRVVEILDEWAAFGKPLEITEFDMGCPDDGVHADYVRQFMTAAFSHESVQAFILWGFWEGSHWRAKDSAAMFRRDWSKRPAQQVFEDLVFGEWWTRWDGQTGPDGRAKLRAFHGEHVATAERGGRKVSADVTVNPEQPSEIVLRLP